MNFDSFFNPKSVAMVGVSQHKGKVGYEMLANILAAGYEGEIYPVNPGTDTIQGIKCYPDLLSIGQVPELVVIVVPARIVPAIMRQCAKLKVKSVIIITAGFKEVGKEGAELEEQVVQIAKQAGIRLIGPNCLGVIAPANKLNASFGGKLPAEGIVGYLSQSGALLAAVLDMANARSIGFSRLVSVGNKADVRLGIAFFCLGGPFKNRIQEFGKVDGIGIGQRIDGKLLTDAGDIDGFENTQQP